MDDKADKNNEIDSGAESTFQRDGAAIRAVLDVMARLRDPQDGCPWDKEQTFATIAPYTIEEAYEVADAIQRADLPALKEELGDLLFQVAFHARMAEEQGAFDFADVSNALAAKMVARHPHVFGGTDMRTAEEQTRAWETQKAEERARKRPDASLLDDVAMALPALMRAEKLTKRAARINFDWPNAEAVLKKLDEELAELDEARGHADLEAMTEEMGDILFVMANLARKLGVDPEEALRRANTKFTSRFQHIERRLAEMGKTGKQPLDELEALWVEAKTTEKKSAP
ncbi:MAG TPA: nucleoside triphosphate pyrophosphohydrolase [Caulobacterales bacterium]|nr:nucleoside triphosphate pyrophosphohydrolase [Caulobacterales bacterium]